MSQCSVVVASFNVHCGVDGWGRSFDVVGACKQIDADVLVLQEVWAPDSKQSFAQRIADEGGYQLVEGELAKGWYLNLAPDLPTGPSAARWCPPLRRNQGGPHPGPPRTRVHTGQIQLGGLRVSLLSRVPLQRREVIELPKLPRDRSRRKALVVEIAPDGGVPLTVVGTHLGHLEFGSVVQMRALRTALDAISGPVVLMGDMNSWGPLLLAVLRGWRRAVLGRTYPSWRPHSQIDHVLLRGSLRATAGEVLASLGSDHRPVRARVTW